MATDSPGSPQKGPNISMETAGGGRTSVMPPRDVVVIGRGGDCDIVLKDLKASRRHCRVTRREDGYTVEDLGSQNGTFVDGKKIGEPTFVSRGHTFKIGDTVFYLS